MIHNNLSYYRDILFNYIFENYDNEVRHFISVSSRSIAMSNLCDSVEFPLIWGITVHPETFRNKVTEGTFDVAK